MKLRRPKRKDLPLLWDGFMVYLALLNVGLIVFDWTYELLRAFYLDHVPGLVSFYDPWHEQFWLLDLPFLLFFAGEFFTRWVLVVRRGRLRHWSLYPLVYWYDLLGIVPLAEFRFFRLFRVISIYLRLKRSDLSAVGDDPVSRSVTFLADVFLEEISDRVAIRILTMAEREVRQGVLTTVLREVLIPRRQEVRRKVSAKVTEIVEQGELSERARHFLRLNLEEAVREAPVLRRIPLPSAVKRPLVTGVGEAVYDSIVETLSATLRSPEGQEALEELVDAVMGSFEAELGRGEIETLLEEAVLDALREMERALAVKRWAEPDPADAIRSSDSASPQTGASGAESRRRSAS